MHVTNPMTRHILVTCPGSSVWPGTSALHRDESTRTSPQTKTLARACIARWRENHGNLPSIVKRSTRPSARESLTGRSGCFTHLEAATSRPDLIRPKASVGLAASAPVQGVHVACAREGQPRRGPFRFLQRRRSTLTRGVPSPPPGGRIWNFYFTSSVCVRKRLGGPTIISAPFLRCRTHR